jgi:hypothetical protein
MLRMVLKHSLYLCPDMDLLLRVTKQVSHQSCSISIDQLDYHHKVRTRGLQSWMDGMPDALPTEDLTAA